MKKFLALVLALVMTLGLATVGTNAAAYKDANDINYKEAVEVMSAVGVFKGDENGFRPADTLKRSEGAKLIAYLLLGNKTAEAMQGSGNKFTDVPATHWACGFIEYLASVGVVGGVGNGKFDPDGQLTATQFAKMLLIALGYDAELEGLVGGEWSINTQKLANSNDLFDALDKLVGSEPVKREEAAQLCLNALKADMVEYEDKGTTVKIGESTVVTGAKNAKTKETNNDKKYDGKDTGEVQLVEELYGKDLQLDKDADAFKAPANKWTYKGEEVGTFAADDDVIFTKDGEVKTNALYNAIGKSAYDKLVDTATTVNDKDELEVYVNGRQVADENDYPNYFVKDTTNTVAPTGNGTTLTMYKTKGGATNDDYDLYTIVIKNVYAVQATSDYNKTSESVNIQWIDSMGTPNGALPSKIEQDDFDVSGVKEDDYLIVTFADGEIQSVAPATVVEGAVSSFKATDSVTIDGTTYKFNKLIQATLKGKNATFEIDSEAKLILDTFGYIVCVDEAKGSDSYAYLQDLENNKNNNATLYFTDGTSKTVTVKKILGNTDYENKFVEGDNKLNRWYTYSIDDAGRYTLKAVGADYTTLDAAQVYAYVAEPEDDDLYYVTKKNQVKFLSTTGYAGVVNDVKANASTTVFVLDDDENVTVYTGIDNIPTIKVKNAGNVLVNYVKDEDTNFAKYVFVDASGAKTSVDDSSTASNYVFLLKDPGKEISVAGDKSYAEADILLNGELVKNAKFKWDNAGDYAQGDLFKDVKTNSDGWYTSGKEFEDDGEKQISGDIDNIGKPITYKDGVLSLGNDVSFVLDCNVTLVYLKGCAAMKDTAADYEVNTVSGSGLASALRNYFCTAHIYAIRADKDSNKLTALYVFVETCEDIEDSNILTLVLPKDVGVVPSANVTLVNFTTDKYIYTGEGDVTFTFVVEEGNVAVDAVTEGATTLEAGDGAHQYSYNADTKTLTIKSGFTADGQITLKKVAEA